VCRATAWLLASVLIYLCSQASLERVQVCLFCPLDEISQAAHTDKVLERFGMMSSNPVGTPAEGRLVRDGEGVVDYQFMSLVGSLLYAATVTRPDTAFAVQRLGRHLQAAGDAHWLAAKRVLRYLEGTRYTCTKYSDSSSELVSFCGAGLGEDLDTRSSTAACVFMLSGGAVSWASRLQPTVALSTTEAECTAICAAVQEAVCLRRLPFGLGSEQQPHLPQADQAHRYPLSLYSGASGKS